MSITNGFILIVIYLSITAPDTITWKMWVLSIGLKLIASIYEHYVEDNPTNKHRNFNTELEKRVKDKAKAKQPSLADICK